MARTLVMVVVLGLVVPRAALAQPDKTPPADQPDKKKTDDLLRRAVGADKKVKKKAKPGNHKERAKQLAREADQVKRKKPAEAVKLLLRAYSLYPSPVILYNLGIAYELARRPADAFNAYTGYLIKIDFPTGGVLSKTKATLKALRPKVCLLDISAPYRAGAQLHIDGKLIGVAPLSRPHAVMPGKHEVTARIDDREVAWEPLEAVAGKTMAVKLWRKRGQKVVNLPKARATDVAERPPTLISGEQGAVVVRKPVRTVARRRPIYKRWWFWTAVGVAVGGATAFALSSGGGGDDTPSFGRWTFGEF
jgi:hypothetical protein